MRILDNWYEGHKAFWWRKYHLVDVVVDGDIELITSKRWRKSSKCWVYEVFRKSDYDLRFDYGVFTEKLNE